MAEPVLERQKAPLAARVGPLEGESFLCFVLVASEISRTEVGIGRFASDMFPWHLHLQLYPTFIVS